MQDIYNIWFSRINISNKIKLKILEKISEKELFNQELNSLKNIFEEIEEKYLMQINEIIYKKNLEKIREYMIKNDIKILNYKNFMYPNKLNNIHNKPAYIYVRGNLKILDGRNIAIVGSRKATEYGKKVSKKIAKEISDENINIVSGLAIGIDKFAHLGSLESKVGKTIAVLATGVADNDLYPLENKKVFERILENEGTIVSEYPLGTKAQKHYFPMRNRIISGLSDKIIVVEAEEKSGSLITVEYGLEQGKDIFAIPGNIFSIKSKGTNALIKEGANLLDNINDLFLL